jgi:hypothetical protein
MNHYVGIDVSLEASSVCALLGHASLDTTHIYAEVDLEMKAKALALVDINGMNQPYRRHSLPSLMAFLKEL